MAKVTAKVVINTKRWDEINKQLRTASEEGLPVYIGVFETAGAEKNGVSLVEIAALQEFGSPGGHIPERSFLRQPLRNAAPQIRKAAGKLIKKVIDGELEFNQAMGLLGLLGVKICKKAITDGEGVPPPNAASTIRKKKSSRPLVDTGRLLNAITFQVEGAHTEPTSAESESEPEGDE